jgi:plasmid stabilization system protein ParE
MADKAVTLHPEAEGEYLSSLEWYAIRSTTATINFEAEFTRAIQKIAESPERWPSYMSKCRRYVLRQFPFSIVYRVFPEQVIVFAVAHGSRRPGYWAKRVR